MNFEWRAVIAADQPSLAGHFPGNPLVAGVLILDQLRLAVAAWRPCVVIVALPQVKFVAPLLPQQEFQILIEESGGKCRFRCLRDEALLAQGELRLQSRS